MPASWQWQAGVQMALPWASSLDVSYVGNHGFNRLGGAPGRHDGQPERGRHRRRVPAAEPGPDARHEHGAGRQRLHDNLLRPYRGLGNINQNTTEFWDTYHSIQTSFNRRFRNGFSFGANYTLGLSLKGNTGLQQRLQHAPDGTISLRADQAAVRGAEREPRTSSGTSLKANAVWDLPDCRTPSGAAMRVVGYIVNDWQLSGVLTAELRHTGTTSATATRTTAPT